MGEEDRNNRENERNNRENERNNRENEKNNRKKRSPSENERNNRENERNNRENRENRDHLLVTHLKKRTGTIGRMRGTTGRMRETTGRMRETTETIGIILSNNIKATAHFGSNLHTIMSATRFSNVSIIFLLAQFSFSSGVDK